MVKQSAKTTGPGRKRKTRDDFFEDDAEPEFIDDDTENAKNKDSDNEDSEIEETAEEKRLRLAKAYLQRLKAGAGSDDEEGGLGEEDIAARLKQEALDALGHLKRQIAHRVQLPPLPLASDYNPSTTPSRLFRGHKLSVTATALTNDDATVFSVSKDGSVFQHDVETGTRQRLGFSTAALAPTAATGTNPDWISPSARKASTGALLSAAVSSDGRYFVAGGGDKKIHVWDVRTSQYIRNFPGHKDAVTALAFRDATHQLFSGSLDRSVKIWSLEDMAYIDTLFGHQSEVLGLDALRQERVLSCGADRTCRVWKIPEESQLIYRGYCLTIDCCRYLTGGDWLTGSADGSLQLWGAARKKPLASIRNAHFDPTEPLVEGEEPEPILGAGCVGGAATSWVSSIAVCRGSDLLASGAGDGVVRVWKVVDNKSEAGARSNKVIQEVGGIPIRGFVNSLHIAKSGRFIVAGVGQEPRMGRWLRDKQAKNGVVIHPLTLTDEEEADEEGDE